MSPITIADLPEDVLVLIFPYLEIAEFLSLCAVNKHFYANFLKNPDYWRERTSKTFRVPIHPLLHADGARWYWLYKNLRTKTKVLTWGSSSLGAQGQTKGGNVMWPTEMMVPREIGTIVDLQCG
jgi:SCF-associated factor 1